MRIDGTPSINVATASKVTAWLIARGGWDCESPSFCTAGRVRRLWRLEGVSRLTGEYVELKMSGGRMSAVAVTIDSRDNILKDLDRLVLGWPG